MGSTALLDSLKLLPNFDIPIFEELDAWYVEKHEHCDTLNAENIAEEVNETFELHRAPGVSVGFKWRIWGDIDRVAEVLRKQEVVIFNLVRCDALEYVSSLYLTNIVNKDFNSPQFMLKDATTEEERMKILFRYRMETHDVDLAQYRQVFEEELQRERERIDILRRIQAAGNRVVTMFYEDFAYKRYRFLSALLKVLNHPPMVTWPLVKLQKVSNAYPSENFRNREELFASEFFTEMLSAWDETVVPAEFSLLAV